MAANSVLENEEITRQFLQGYNLLEWPDLSAVRGPDNTTYTSSLRISHIIGTNLVLEVLAVVGRILGVYCGVPDVLLAVQQVDSDSVRFVRVSWGESDTWRDVTAGVNRNLLAEGEQISIESIRRVLDIDAEKPPCLALCRFSLNTSIVHSAYPLTITYDATQCTIHLSSSQTYTHPSVSHQILAQISALTLLAQTHPDSLISSSLSIPSELISIIDRAPDDDTLAKVYSPLMPACFAMDYLAQRAIFSPQATAVRWYPDLTSETTIDNCESITYVELDLKANQLARWLRKSGLKNEDRVAVCMNRDLRFHISLIGIMRSGGCYVPIDPELPVERKTYIAEDSNSRFVLTTKDVSLPSFFGDSAIFLDSDTIINEIDAEIDAPLNVSVLSELAFQLYTSGTTGNPKGCLLTHNGLSQALLALSSTAADVGMEDLTQGRYLAVASIAFDVHLAETFVPLVLGMTLHSAPRSRLLENLPFYVRSLGITHIGIVPSLIEATMGAVDGDGKGTSLRYIASGGEKISDSILDKWADHPRVRLANFYGPSEVTIGCCARFMDIKTPKANIGRPFANVSAYVVDSNLNIVLRGGIGELVVEGPLVGRGYHGRPDLTEKVFLEWPEKGRWSYRTGDLVRIMPDSTLEILGRIDTQIKLRGVRIESEGISSIIRRAASTSSTFVLDASTILAKHPLIRAEQLVSFIAWNPAISVTVRKSIKPSVISPPGGLLESIRHICEVELASYMRPTHIIPLSWLPLNSNGKSDAKSLLGIFNGLEIKILTSLMTRESSVLEARPATQLERDVFTVLVRHTTMPLAFPHPNINIFECGLDSLAVIRFASDLTTTFNKRIAALDIMLSPTLSAISALLGSSSSYLDISPGPLSSFVEEFSSAWKPEVYRHYPCGSVEDILPSFSVQEGVLSRSAEHDTMYIQHVIVALKAGLSLDRLQRAFQLVIKRHSILRTVFYFSSALVQVVLRSGASHLTWEQKETTLSDASNFSRWFLETDAAVTAKAINMTLSVTPPLRVCIYKSISSTFAVLSIHHALFDGISLPLLMDDIEREYHESAPRPPVILADILDQIASINLEKARRFWLDYFKDFFWPPRPLRGATVSSTLYHITPFKSPLSTIKNLANSQKVTIQALLTCTFASIIANNVYHSHDVSFGVIRSGRLIPVQNIEFAMAPMVSIIPTRVDFRLPGNILHQIQRMISAMVEVEHVPLSKVQNWVRPGQPLFETLFSVSVKVNNVSEIWKVVESQQSDADYALSIEVVIDQDHNSLSVQASWTELDFESEAVIRLLEQFEDITLTIGTEVCEMIGEKVVISSRVAHTREGANEMDEFINVDPKTTQNLKRILTEFLHLDKDIVSDTTSLISLGLDSIKSVGLSKLFRQQGYNISAIELMKYPTLKKLGRFISNQGPPRVLSGNNGDPKFSEFLNTLRTSVPLDQLKLAPGDHINIFPTTALQAGMLSQTINSLGVLYVHAFPLLLTKGVSIGRLREAWDQANETFAILRTSFYFITDAGSWVQVVHSSSPLKWTTDTFESEDEYDSKALAYLSDSRLKDEESLYCPPIRIRIFQPSSGDASQTARLIIVMHHALYDGISIGKLFTSVRAMYNGSYTSIPVQFTALLSFFTQQEEKGATFFTELLSDHHPTSLTHRSPNMDDPDMPASYIASRNVVLNPLHLESLLLHTTVTLQCLGQAVWAVLLSSLCGTTDVVFGHIVSGRSIPGAEDVIGPVLNTIPCRVQIFKGLRNYELLKAIHQSNVNALPWQQASLRSIQKNLGTSKLWDSLFLFQPYTPEMSSLEQLWEFVGPEGEANIQYGFNVEMVQQGRNSFALKIACRPDCMTFNELENLVQAFQTSLEHIVSQPDALVLPSIALMKVSGIPSEAARGSIQNPATGTPSIDGEVSSGLIQRLLASIIDSPSDQVAATTPLVALGIDSITAIQISGHFRRAGMKLNVNDIVISRTVSDLTAKVTMLPSSESDSLSSSMSEADVGIEFTSPEKEAILERLGSNAKLVEHIMPASSGMKWLIGAWQKSKRTQFQHTFVYRLPNDFDVERIRKAWMLLLQRLPLLRSTFACAEGGLEPRIVTFRSGHFEDWSEERIDDDAALLPTVLTRMKELVSFPPPTTRPPTRAAIFYSQNQCYFAMHLHHFQFDAWTLPLIIDDLSRLYLGVDAATKNDVQSFLREYTTNPSHLTIQKEYWQSLFPHKFQATLFPSLISHTGKKFSPGRVIYTARAAVTGSALCERRARSLHVSLQAVFLACWAQLQGRHSSATSVTLGLWQAGRSGSISDIGKMVSPCSNIVPMYIQETESTGTIDLARRIQDDLRIRTASVVQSDLVQVDAWLGAGGKPLCNVVVNIVKIAPDLTSQERHLEQVELPYFVPGVVPQELNATLDRLPVTDLIQNDLIVDIATLTKEDSVLMSFDAEPHIMDEYKAKELVEEWARAVVKALGIA